MNEGTGFSLQELTEWFGLDWSLKILLFQHPAIRGSILNLKKVEIEKIPQQCFGTYPLLQPSFYFSKKTKKLKGSSNLSSNLSPSVS